MAIVIAVRAYNIRLPILLLMLSVLLRKPEMNSSYIPSCTIIRVPDTQVCPDATKEAKAAPLIAQTRSASSKMTMGA